MPEYITREEHEEFCKRIDAEDVRQNKRIELLEGSAKDLNTLANSVSSLAQSVANMVKEQERQGERLDAIESRDGERWRSVVGYIITAVASGVIGYFLQQLGM